jgi:hypothetical protein
VQPTRRIVLEADTTRSRDQTIVIIEAVGGRSVVGQISARVIGRRGTRRARVLIQTIDSFLNDMGFSDSGVTIPVAVPDRIASCPSGVDYCI